MSVKNKDTPDWNTIKISFVLSFSILLNYIFWAINSYSFLKFLNFFILICFILNFLFNKKFNKYFFVRSLFISLLVLSLGSVVTDWDARSVWLFHAKRIFYDNSLYGGFDNYMPELMNAYPLLAPSLSATLAKILGYWNEVFPKSTNIIVLLPALLIQCSFIKNNKFNLIWIMFIILFSGRILINGRTDGLVAMYFVSISLIVYKLFIENNLNFGSANKTKKINRLFLYFSGIFLGVILTLLKNEGLVLMGLILGITILFKIFYRKKFSFDFIFFNILIFLPIIFWKLMTVYHGIYPWVEDYGQNLYHRIFLRFTDFQNYKILFSYLFFNEKLILSLLIFIFAFFKKFKKNKMIFKFIIVNASMYYLVLCLIYLSTPYNLDWHLNSSAHRVLISIVLLLTYFSVLSLQKEEIILWKKKY
tara:strand:- start:4742 stop:5998 length:1257 start_codon:yes stop_codon:yes gene_type:complete